MDASLNAEAALESKRFAQNMKDIAAAKAEAEMKRMIAIGNKRYKEHLKKDKELGKLVAKNKAANDARMKAMAAHYATELDAVRATMKKNRAHASKMLSKKTAALYSAIAKSEQKQAAINGKLNSQLATARLDIADSLRAAKADFTKRMTNLHQTVAKN